MEHSMHTSEREGGIRVELYERRELPPPAQTQVDEVHHQLDALADQGTIAAVERAEWVKRTPVDDCNHELRDTYLSFTTWARESGTRLTPFFQTRECFTPDEGEHTDWLVLPAFCLAVYEGDTLSAVYPHADEQGTRTVQDGVQALLVEDPEDGAPKTVAAD